jgi:uncharacterized protein
MLPPYDSRDTLERLAQDVSECKAEAVYCLGDSFHDVDAFARLHDETQNSLQRLTRALEWHWIVGNHDPHVAEDLGGESHAEIMCNDIILRHEAHAGEVLPEISGHYHPKLRVQQRGRLISRRCFVRSARKLILPSYGSFTGGLDVTDKVYVPLCGQSFDALVLSAGNVLRFDVAKLRF